MGSIALHTDFDRGGLRIGNVLVARHDARPWRFTAEVRGGSRRRRTTAASHHGRPLGSRDWALLRRHGRGVLEEHVLDNVLRDLAME